MTEKKFEHVERIRIPDEEAPAWMQTLREGGFNDDEIDMIMAHCNAVYFELKKPKMIEQEVESIKRAFFKEYGKALSEGEVEYIRNGVGQRLDELAP